MTCQGGISVSRYFVSLASFPHKVRTDTGARPYCWPGRNPTPSRVYRLRAFARVGPGASRSPPSLLIFGPPTPRRPSATAPVPLAVGLPRCGCLFLPALQREPTYAGASEIRTLLAPAGRGVPRKRRGLPGYWVVLFGRAGFEHPVQARRDSPSCVAPAPPSAPLRAWAPGNGYFGAECSGPHARLPTHRLCCCCHRRKAGYRPAGLRFGRVGFAPTGRRSGFQGLIVFSLPTRPALPGRTSGQLAGRSLAGL